MLTQMQIRIFYRLIEFSAGKDSSNPLPFHEAYFYALEAPSSIMKGPDAQLPGIRALMKRRSRKMGSEGGGELLVAKSTTYTSV